MKKYWLIGCSILLTASMRLGAQELNQIDSVKNYFEIQEVNIQGKKKNEGPLHTVNADQMQKFNMFNVSDAVNMLPGVSITQMGARNEGSFMLRGFNSLRTPVFYDGVPIYVPYAW